VLEPSSLTSNLSKRHATHGLARRQALTFYFVPSPSNSMKDPYLTSLLATVLLSLLILLSRKSKMRKLEKPGKEKHIGWRYKEMFWSNYMLLS
jgi:hypothetical protein